MKYTIVITTFNSQKSISKVLDGIAQLTYQPDEIILIDDSSIDETLLIVRNRENEFSNIRVIQNLNNMGQSYSRNLQQALNLCGTNLISHNSFQVKMTTN